MEDSPVSLLEELWARKQRSDAKLNEFQSRTFNFAKEELATNPSYDLYWLEDEFYLDIDLPGVFEKDISVDLALPHLQISGTYPSLAELGHQAYIESKRQHGSFAYSFLIPHGKMVQHYEYQLEQGVLHLKIQFHKASPDPLLLADNKNTTSS